MAPTALLSVSNKEGLVPLAQGLLAAGYQLISSGGTAAALSAAGVPVTKVAEHTGAPEILGGRVKTLHPRIHGGILAKRSESSHQSDLVDQGIAPIDVVVVNLYPFRETIARPDVSWDAAIENIDIGGPAMVRAAAKNHADVAVLTSPAQYPAFLKALAAGAISPELRRQLALEAFSHTAEYDTAISQWLSAQLASQSAGTFSLELPARQSLRYGENPHQSATWYAQPGAGLGAGEQLQGKELSYNNILDLEAALATVREFGYGGQPAGGNAFKPAAVVVKHTNPCGVATGTGSANAIERALDADRLSAFGGIVAINGPVDGATAGHLTSLFLECVVAPSFDPEARELLSAKANLRLLELAPEAIERASRQQLRSVLGGLLVQ
ncbi:MAG: bifunctional phosphoribosylaminoimidazolecarboxamide formyltransferase/IMP cyclohydrolase, partial [Cyanobacteria bacterium]|nr:bifunctional phosphoribosylaminoimidazolecarboxamide formyltransferase/IMP cyclohydrolase [Cyanobacteriota bacterium]